jgi:hypothetical protein
MVPKRGVVAKPDCRKNPAIKRNAQFDNGKIRVVLESMKQGMGKPDGLEVADNSDKVARFWIPEKLKRERIVLALSSAPTVPATES